MGGFDHDALCVLLNIPDDVQPMCIIEFRYPAGHRPLLMWYTEEAVHWQSYDCGKPRILRALQMLQDDIAKGVI